jgi:hypothetical protein
MERTKHKQTFWEREYRPYKWDPRMIKDIKKMALQGHSKQSMADYLDVSIRTFEYWEKTKPEFKKALKKSTTFALSQVAHALFKRALGFSHPETIVTNYQGKVTKTVVMKYVIPDVQAALKILALRDREHWAEILKSEANVNINVNKIDTTDMSTDELAMLEKIGLKQISPANVPNN